MLAAERLALVFTIGDKTYNTWKTWKLIPSEIPTVQPPEVKTEYVDIPGYSKRLDFTEALHGSVPVGASTGSWKFYVLHPAEVGGSTKEAYGRWIQNTLHGKRGTVKLGDQTYSGRFTLASYVPHVAPDFDYSEVEIGYDLDPKEA